MDDAVQALAGAVSEHLHGRAEDIVNEWVEWVLSRESAPPAERLSFSGVRNHIPPVIENLGHYVRNPVFAVREEMLGHLRMHGRIRRDQGYDLGDTMAELDGLSHMVMRTVEGKILEVGDEHGLEAALTVFGRLSAGLRAMSFVTLGVYRESEQDWAQELGHRLAEFGRTVAHELRSPLNSISLSAEVLDDPRMGAQDDQRHQQLQVIRKAVAHAGGLLHDIDMLAMVESAQTTSRAISIPALLEGSREELAPRADAVGVILRFPAQPPDVAVESVVAQLALTNLLSNAIKYSDPDKPKRHVEVRVQAYLDQDPAMVEFEVEDNGLGIADHLQPRVFQRHFRAHPETAEGTGLGLAITQDLVTERGGSVELTSREGSGTCVTVRLQAMGSANTSRDFSGESLMHQAVRELLQGSDQEGSGR